MAKKEPEYPHPKKGERVKCLGCNDGKVYHRLLGWVNCKACKGKGFIVAK